MKNIGLVKRVSEIGFNLDKNETESSLDSQTITIKPKHGKVSLIYNKLTSFLKVRWKYFGSGTDPTKPFL